MSDEVDTSFCIVEEEDVELFLGKTKLTKQQRDDLEVEGVGDFEI